VKKKRKKWKERKKEKGARQNPEEVRAWDHLWERRKTGQLSHSLSLATKISLISKRNPLGTVPDIKLIRTDTTLDHSQEAEKQRRKNFTVPTGNSSHNTYHTNTQRQDLVGRAPCAKFIENKNNDTKKWLNFKFQIRTSGLQDFLFKFYSVVIRFFQFFSWEGRWKKSGTKQEQSLKSFVFLDKATHTTHVKIFTGPCPQQHLLGSWTKRTKRMKRMKKKNQSFFCLLFFSFCFLLCGWCCFLFHKKRRWRHVKTWKMMQLKSYLRKFAESAFFFFFSFSNHLPPSLPRNHSSFNTLIAIIL